MANFVKGSTVDLKTIATVDYVNNVIEDLIQNRIQGSLIDSYYFDTSNSTGPKAPDVTSLTGEVFRTIADGQSKVLMNCVTQKSWHLPFNIGIRIKVSSIAKTENILNIKVNNKTVGTLKASDLTADSVWHFRNFIFENNDNSMNIVLETTAVNNGVTISIENIFIAPIGRSTLV